MSILAIVQPQPTIKVFDIKSYTFCMKGSLNNRLFYRTQVSLGSGLWVSVSLFKYKSFLKLYWCDSGWRWYQFNTKLMMSIGKIGVDCRHLDCGGAVSWFHNTFQSMNQTQASSYTIFVCLFDRQNIYQISRLHKLIHKRRKKTICLWYLRKIPNCLDPKVLCFCERPQILKLMQ